MKKKFTIEQMLEIINQVHQERQRDRILGKKLLLADKKEYEEILKRIEHENTTEDEVGND